MSYELQIRTHERDGAAVVVPTGEVDLSCSPDLRVALQSALGSRPSRVVVDMNGVPSIDSSGLATLIEAMRDTQKIGVGLVLCGLQERVMAVLEIARLDKVFTLAADVDAAIAAGQP